MSDRKIYFLLLKSLSDTLAIDSNECIQAMSFRDLIPTIEKKFSIAKAFFQT